MATIKPRKKRVTKVEAAPPGTGIELRGDCRALFASREHEVILSGGADTGKTVAACIKAHTICTLIAGAQGAIVRKTNHSLASSVLRTFQRIIEGQGVRAFGGETPSRFIYPNGSVIWTGGMDNPDRVLSSERDFIYVCQCEELTLNDWETLATRCSGRAAVVQDPQLFGDCNPAGSKHWIRERAKGPLRLLVATHRDNPGLYDEQGQLTPDGVRRIGVLENLTGVRRKRLLEGIWATAEGAVFEMFDVEKHRCVRKDEEMKRWFLCQDEGFTNPAVILLVGADSDGRWHVFREWYKRGVVQADVIAQAKQWFAEKKCELDAVDDAAADLIAGLKAAGVNAKGGKGRILLGINALQDRLKVLQDGKPRLTVDPGCVNLINEFESHIWKPEKDVPVDADNHAIAALRYLEDVVAVPSGVIDRPDAIRVGPSRVDVPRFQPRRLYG